MADFGNPLVLGGNFEVLSTKIFFAVVGAAHDQGRAAVLSIVLLGFTLGGVLLQHAWLGKTRLHDGHRQGRFRPAAAAAARRRLALLRASRIPWALFTFVVYAIILVGGFVRAMGRDYTPTLEHYLTGFRIEQTPTRAVLLRLGLEFVLRDAQGRGARGAAHRRRSASSPPIC